MKFQRSFRIILVGLFLILSTVSLQAQITAGQQPIGVQYSIVPVAGYNSDFGLFGGGLFQRIDYGMGATPFKTLTAVELTASTKGNLIGKLDFEQMTSFGTNIRSRYRFDGLRLLNHTYFGIGNNTEFSGSDFDNGYYYYEERIARLRYWGRKTLTTYGEAGNVDGQLLATISYSNPVSKDHETVFNENSTPGAEGGWVNQIGLGVIIDDRDKEIDPRHGYRFETNARFSGSLTGSDYSFSSFFTEARAYLSPIKNLVIAQKLEYRHAIGNVPFWELPAVGNDNGLRGYALNRFRGESSILHIVEVRAWLFSFYDDQLRLGLQAFLDTGRVFDEGDRFRDLPSGLKQTFGFGGAFSVLNPDFIFRGDIAFSEDIYRIYFGVGFLF